MALTKNDYLQQLQNLLPKGPAWPCAPNNLITLILDFFAEEFCRVDLRIDDLLNEADPRVTYELLSDWERVAGLPDPCVTIDQSIEQRRISLTSKLTMQGGQSRQYFIDLAASMGYANATIDEYEPFQCGFNACGDAVWSEDDRFCWQINLPSDGATIYFSAGESTAGESLVTWGDEAIECRINRFKPAHTIANFAYV